MNDKDIKDALELLRDYLPYGKDKNMRGMTAREALVVSQVRDIVNSWLDDYMSCYDDALDEGDEYEWHDQHD